MTKRERPRIPAFGASRQEVAPARLAGLPCPPPPAAITMYERNTVLVPWTDQWRDKAVAALLDLKSRWRHTRKADREWDQAEPEIIGGRQTFLGNCNDFFPMLKAKLVDQGFPEDALRLVLCRRRGEPHMILDLETDHGSILCDYDDYGIAPLADKRWAYHDLLFMEGPGRTGWLTIKPLDAGSLADIIDASKPA